MEVEIKIDSSYTEPKIIIMAASMTEDINNIVKKISEETSLIISGSRNDKIEVLEQSELIRIYAGGGRVFAVTDKGEYILRLRLYELEKRLSSCQFVRISNSEIINLKKVSHFDLSFTGTICVKLSNNTTTYVSRRYVSKVKKILGICGEENEKENNYTRRFRIFDRNYNRIFNYNNYVFGICKWILLSLCA